MADNQQEPKSRVYRQQALNTIRADVAEAEAELKAARQALLRDDGAHRYSDTEHSERLQAAMNRFHQRLSAAGRDAQAIAADARAERAKLAGADPVAQLTSAELAVATAKKSFIQEDATALPLDELARRIRSVVADGDRTTTWLYARYGSRRLAELRRAAAEGKASADSDGSGDVQAAIDEAARLLDPGRAAAASELEAGENEALGIQIYIATTQRQMATYGQRDTSGSRQGARSRSDAATDPTTDYLRKRYG